VGILFLGGDNIAGGKMREAGTAHWSWRAAFGSFEEP